jgi:hypothetical protein
MKRSWYTGRFPFLTLESPPPARLQSDFYLYYTAFLDTGALGWEVNGWEEYTATGHGAWYGSFLGRASSIGFIPAR